MKLTDKQKELIEKLGVVNEKSGMQPAAARVVSLLTVADKVELTFDEIREVLNLSKGATSNAINLLLMMNKIDYVTKSGDRKRYFRSRLMQWKDDMVVGVNGLMTLSELLQEIHDARTKETVDFNAELLTVIDFLEYLHKKLPGLVAQWEKEHKK